MAAACGWLPPVRRRGPRRRGGGAEGAGAGAAPAPARPLSARPTLSPRAAAAVSTDMGSGRSCAAVASP